MRHAIYAAMAGALTLSIPLWLSGGESAYLIDSDADAVSMVTFEDGSRAIAATYPDGSWRKPYAVFASRAACERELASLPYSDEYACEALK